MGTSNILPFLFIFLEGHQYNALYETCIMNTILNSAIYRINLTNQLFYNLSCTILLLKQTV